MKLYNYLFDFVVLTTKLHNIDESHALKHSMDVFYFANILYKNELMRNKSIIEHKNIIDTASILHDMCDKKYLNEVEGIIKIKDYLQDKINENDINISLKIISTMSYSTVNKNGYPDLKEYQLAYNIVREADLLASYDFDRCIMYQMLKRGEFYGDSFIDAKDVFNKRVLKYRENNLFTLKLSKSLSLNLHNNAIKRIKFMSKLIKK